MFDIATVRSEAFETFKVKVRIELANLVGRDTQDVAQDIENMGAEHVQFEMALDALQGHMSQYGESAVTDFIEEFEMPWEDADDVDAIVALFPDAFLGEYTPEEYAEHLVDESCDLPEIIADYIDYKRFARDMIMNGDIVGSRNGYLFNHNV